MFKIDFKLVSKEINVDKAIDLSDAIEKAYQYEDCVLFSMEGVTLLLPLPHVFSEVLESFLDLSIDLISASQGELIYGISNDDFLDSDWKLKWGNDGNLTINFEWRLVENYDNVESLPSILYINKKDFLFQFKYLFNRIRVTFEDTTLDHDDELKKIIFICDKI